MELPEPKPLQVESPESIKARLEAAKAALGTRWVGHPDYQFSERHSTNADLYVPARQPFLGAIRHAAANDRQHKQATRTVRTYR